jgi:N-acetylmuramoyl-L-alanine amidase
MRQINYIVLHCTATSPKTTVESIQRFWKESNGWKDPGYHHIIKADGTIVNLQPIEKPSNGVKGHNANSIHISYVGGIDEKGRAKDTRTDAQKQSQILLLKKYKQQFPSAVIQGHRDFPGVTKECPSFEVKEWLDCIGLH